MEPSVEITDVAQQAGAQPHNETPPCSPLTASLLVPGACRRRLQVGSIPPLLIKEPPSSADFHISHDEIMTNARGPVHDEKDMDCIVVGPHQWSQEIMPDFLLKLKQLLGKNGQISFITNSKNDLISPRIDGILATVGLMRYRLGPLEHKTSTPNLWGLVIVASDYNPVAHARDLAEAERPDGAIEILDNIPADMIVSNELLVHLALEKQKHYLSWQRLRSSIDPPHALFTRERREFAQVTAIAPGNLESYRLHAQFWKRIGRTDMAHRVLRSIAHLDTNLSMASQRDDSLIEAASSPVEESPVWDKDAPPPRILIITHTYSDYGMDTLYHGLCKLLGHHNVVEFPWKPTLHGQNFEAANNYPCVFSYPGLPLSVSELEAELRQGKFDLILYGDVVQMAHADDVRRLVNANPDIPVILYDTWDDCHIPLERLLRYTGRDRFDLIFKREMLDGVDYGPDTFPLPFGYALQREPTVPQGEKKQSLFWAGKREFGLRALYIQYLEKKLGHPLDRQYDQATYQRELGNSRMGLSFFGCGFDSVRYWELPAHSVMLMAERPPIRIPHNFVDGQTAVFFDDLPEMAAKLDYYLNRPQEMARIAEAGHAHYLKYHRCENRARQMLGRVDRHLKGMICRKASERRQMISGVRNRPEISKIHLGLVKGENYGWGVCSRYLMEELPKLRPVSIIKDDDGSSHNANLPGPLFQALTNVTFEPLFELARGNRNYGYTFFENELTRQSLENAKQYDLVLAGSSWCRDRMLEAGITNCDVLLQGIDPKRFYPIVHGTPHDRFVIFSGGKFELRKGQDILLRAVKILQDRYPDIHLVNCWYNLWPESLRQMSNSPYITFTASKGETWQETMRRTYTANGLDPERITTLDLVPHEKLRELYAQTDIAVFPNRCEGGTNLVLMEYMACAKPVIAAATSGHNDVVTADNALLLRQLKDINIVDEDGGLVGRWQDPSLDELVAQIEYAYLHRDAIRLKARQAGNDLKRYTWQHCAEKLVEIIDQ